MTNSDDNNSITEYVKGRVEDQIAWFGKKAHENKTKFRVYQTMLIIIGASIPIVNLLDNVPIDPKLMSAVLGGLVSIITAFMQMNKFEETWFNYRTSSTRLKKEKYLFTLSSGDYAGLNPDEKNRKFVERIEGLLSEEQDKKPEKSQ